MIPKLSQYPPLHPEAQWAVMLAYGALIRRDDRLAFRGVLDALWAEAAGLS